MITLQGDQDALLPIATDSNLYAQMVDAAHRSSQYRHYTVRGGNHVDSQFDDHFGVDTYGTDSAAADPAVRPRGARRARHLGRAGHTAAPEPHHPAHGDGHRGRAGQRLLAQLSRDHV
jgi:hypothetical protein